MSNILTKEEKEEFDLIVKFVKNFSEILLKNGVKEVQVKMLQHYTTVYIKEKFIRNSKEEETIGDLVEGTKNSFFVYKKEIEELLDIINIEVIENKVKKKAKDMFIKFLDLYEEKYLTNQEM